MHSPRRRSLHRKSDLRLIAMFCALALVSACTSSVAGVPVPSAAAPGTPTSAGGSGADQITEPSVLPHQSTATTPGTTARTSTSATAPGKVAGPIPKGLEKFYGQQLAWGSCPSYATDTDAAAAYKDTALECARLTVPLAYSEPSGPTVKIAVLRKVATDPSSRIGSLVVDPGGPGASGMEFVAESVVPTGKQPSAVQAPIAALNQKFDIIGIDPRGVGSSLPAVHCQTDAERDLTRAHDQRSRNQADVDAANAATRKIVSECLANTGKAEGIDGRTFLANIGTRDVAKDLDVLRAVLGDAKLSYLGFSYGTEIGWEYAEQFATNVRAILFDGDIDPDQDPATSDIGQQKSFQAAFVTFAAWCAQNSPSCVLGTDPSKALATYQALVRPLLDRQLQLTDGRLMSFGDAVTGTSVSLYFNQLRATLARALLNLKQGNGNLLMALADTYDSRDATGHYSNELEAFNAVRCVDGPRMTDPAEVTKFNAAIAAVAPYEANGDPAGAILDTCALWPVPPTLLPHKLKITGLPKTLVISTTGDPATPYANGVELAKEIGGTLLTVQGVRHTSYLTNGLTCVDDIGNAYLLTLALPKAGTVCS